MILYVTHCSIHMLQGVQDELTYPQMYFTVDDFDDSFDKVSIEPNQSICVELVATFGDVCLIASSICSYVFHPFLLLISEACDDIQRCCDTRISCRGIQSKQALYDPTLTTLTLRHSHTLLSHSATRPRPAHQAHAATQIP